MAAPVQKIGLWGPQSLARVPGPQAESSSTPRAVPHVLPTQVATSASPSHAAGEVHTAGDA